MSFGINVAQQMQLKLDNISWGHYDSFLLKQIPPAIKLVERVLMI